MEIDGTVVTQSDTILRYAGRLSNSVGVELYPQGKLLEVDECLNLIDEMSNAWLPRLYVGMQPRNFGYPDTDEFKGSGEHQKATKAARERFIEEELPKYLTIFADRLKSQKFLCGTAPTICDCYLVPLLRRLASGGVDYVDTQCIAKNKEVQAYVDRFMALPEIKAWYETEHK